MTSPLEEEELIRLESFLVSDQTPDTAMPIDMVEGFITAILSSPEQIPANEWLPHVWGNEESPKYESDEQESDINRLLLSFHSDIANQLDLEPEYSPLWEGLDNEELELSVHLWSVGYVRGMELDVDSWATIEADSDTHTYLIPIMLSAMDPEDPPEEFAEVLKSPEQRQILRKAIPEAVCVLYDYWQDSRFFGDEDFDGDY